MGSMWDTGSLDYSSYSSLFGRAVVFVGTRSLKHFFQVVRWERSFGEGLSTQRGKHLKARHEVNPGDFKHKEG